MCALEELLITNVEPFIVMKLDAVGVENETLALTVKPHEGAC